jgi:hypothetical protein
VKHAVIDLANRKLFQRAAPRTERRRQIKRSARTPLPHSPAATRFAEICAAIGGMTMLHDLMPDIVTLSFGTRTAEIRDRLHARGWTCVGLGDWKGERVLGVSFGGDRRAKRTADELADALIAIVGELEIAETRVW